MKNTYCVNCPSNEFVNEGNCLRFQPDGHVVRCGPQWTITKHKYFEEYCKILTHTMPNSFKELIFIDLYSGPGLYSNRKSGEIQKGSPLIALDYNFKQYHFVDLNPENIEALEHRIGSSRNCHFYTEDANKAVLGINNTIPPNSLAFCLADPDSMAQLKFSTLKTLFNNRRIDFLINYPYWMYFKRTARQLMENNAEDNPIDEFMGSKEWKGIFKSNKEHFDAQLFHKILKSYCDNFYFKGYVKPDETKYSNYVIIRNSLRNPIYLLLFFSKNQLGYKFWDGGVRKIKKEIDPSLGKY
jgi:three-Cys-motif partner protein